MTDEEIKELIYSEARSFLWLGIAIGFGFGGLFGLVLGSS